MGTNGSMAGLDDNQGVYALVEMLVEGVVRVLLVWVTEKQEQQGRGWMSAGYCGL